jgi:hypothetical protein
MTRASFRRRARIGTCVVFTLALPLACASGNEKDGPAAIDSGTTLDTSRSDTAGSDVSFDASSSDSSTFDGGCASSITTAMQAPASLLFVLDRSNGMSSGGKWTNAALAIVSAVDQDTFDTMSIGLLASPSSMVAGPSCILGFPVACGNPALPQIAVKPAGKEKSTGTTGVRSEIYKWLTTNSPDTSSGSGTPLYEALKGAYAAVRLSTAAAKRIVVFVVNGAADCTSLSSPTRPGYVDPNGCSDWEYPASIVTLIKAAHDDAAKPVLTFVVGVPGADTTGSDPSNEPPYHLKLALSAYAKAGAPELVDPACNGTFVHPGGTDPAVSCHFDMTSGTLDAEALAKNIVKMRGAALGCIYDLPVPTDGSTVDRNKVNVRIESKAGGTDLKKRSSPSDDCATDGCWDYTTDGKIELLGKACVDAKALTDGSVKIVVGCATIIK